MPSEVLEEFLKYLEECKRVYDETGQNVHKEDCKVQDFLHQLEFCNKCKERSKISTQFHNSRTVRRKAKDKHLEVEKLAKFYADPANKAFIKAIKRLIQLQKETENYIYGERHYNKRGDEEE